MEPLKICYLTSEVHPFSKTGGLADVSAALSRYLASRGHDVRVFTPLYSKIETKDRGFRLDPGLRNIPLRVGKTTVTFSIARAKLPASDLEVRFVDCAPLYHRPGIYTGGVDDAVRFGMLSRAALESCQRMGWSPDVFHVHDWHAALTPFYLRTLYSWDRLFHGCRTALTIHNIGYQGIFPASTIEDLGLANDKHLLHQEDLNAGRIGFMKTGILYADVLTAVSPTYAREIQTPELGPGLHDLLRARRSNLFGILNGIDRDEWDPSRDRFIPVKYSAKSLTGKGKNKKVLLEKMGLLPTTDAPVLGIVSRLTVQKGFELLFETLPPLLAREDVRVVVLGTGEARYEGFFQALQDRFRGRVSFYRGFSNELAHLIEAGSDLFLMPSLYEPCGLNQMYSLAYGTAPVVRKTGGLADTVELFDAASGTGTGFVFEHFNAEALRWALDYAIRTYKNRPAWRKLMLNAMSRDFSWETQGEKYVELYSRLSGRGWPPSD